MHHVLSREQQDIELFNGRIDPRKIETLLKSFAPASKIDHAFLCGPGAMIEDAKATLKRLGTPDGHIHIEYFSTDGIPVAPRRAAVGSQTPSSRSRMRMSRCMARPTIFRCSTAKP